MRPLSASDYETYKQKQFDDWIKALRDKSKVEINDIWKERVPSDPVFPAELESYMQQVQQQLSQPQQPPVLPTP